MERVGGFVELFTQKVPAVCARQKNNPSTASGPPSFARKVKCFPYGIAPTFPPSLKGGRERRYKQIARLRNKCAMTDYGHPELVSVSCGLNPSPAFQAPSPQVAREKIRSVGDMKQNSFTDTVYSQFTYS